MNKLITICFLVVLGAASVASATWTHHVWEFKTDNQMPDPDVVELGPGIDAAKLRVTPASGGWQDGVWSLSGEIDIILDNDPTPRERKEITILLTWMPGKLDAFIPDRPLVGVTPLGLPDDVPLFDMTLARFDDPVAGSDWTLSTYNITIWPNPPEEWIAIKGDISVDKLEIFTECIPEPATMALLGLGGLTLLRIRRKR